MALNTFTPTYPNQALGTGDTLALAIEEFTGLVEGTIARVSKIAPYIPVRPVKGTSTITNRGIGESTLQKVTPGVTPDGTTTESNRINLTVDTVILARDVVFILDDFQADFSYRSEIASEHGKKIAKFYDQTFAIQAAKAAAQSASSYGTLDGHFGGTTITLATSGDATDPAALYQAVLNLFAGMELKDVDPVADGVVLVLRPDVFYTLMDADQIIRADYLTSNGNMLNQVHVLKAVGVPVISSNNIPNTNITSHLLSNARNSNAYDGDFTKLVACAFSPRSLLAGETIPLTANTWFDDADKCYKVDSWLSFGVTPNRAEFSGRIVKP